ncbi:MAG: 2,3,4,5-tetrahydropyridine-2,6-dicarboxylate N-acetyltransferase [Bacteroidota bacterium]
MKKFLFITLRILKYKLLSDCGRVQGNPKLYHPLLMKGKGVIQFGDHVQLGVVSSPFFYSNYSYLEARSVNSLIKIGNHVSINNNFSATAQASIEIQDHVLIGYNCSIIDHDGHGIGPHNRFENEQGASVCIEKNVFIGSNVTVLKGVTIGENSVVGNGSVVTKSIPKNTVFAGNPAKFIREI